MIAGKCGLAAACLLEGQKGFYVALVYLGDEAKVVKVAFLLLGLLCQDVAVVSVFSFDLS